MDLLALPFLGRALRTRAEALRPKMYRVAFAWTHDAALADDLAQEALARGLERLGQLRDAERLEAWLFRILANCWRDAMRRRLDTEDIEEHSALLESTEPDPEQRHASVQLAGRVRAAVAMLPAGQRQVVSLVDLGEFSYADAANILEIPIGTVMSRLCRARAALRQLLAADGPAEVVPLSEWRRNAK
ncbi:MAG TPA: RNA polymerase sigma factor [Usitatibacter sp.]|nr:RNA polymerase sigma factor [Usitatibacter sp.]